MTNQVLTNQVLTNQVLTNQSIKNKTFYDDPISYNGCECGMYYIIKKKISNKKKIIAESILINNESPEYLSKIFDNVNNLKKIMGDDWGYRLYFDNSIFHKNISTHKQFLIELKQLLIELNKLDFVELYSVNISDEFRDENNYPIGLIAINYRFHASLDKSKDIVYMKDNNWSITKELANKLQIFENSNKLATYYFFPWYKPPTHALVQYPFSISAYFWGIKPNKMWNKYNTHYSLDDIFTYIKKFDETDGNFFNREKSNKLYDKTAYGSDEIVLTDLIFSGFKTKETKPFGQLYDFNSILLFFIIYTTYKDDNSFKDVLNEAFAKVGDKVKKTILKDNWNMTDLDKFLFGDLTKTNRYCCILPLYDTIPDKNRTKIFYMPYLTTLYNMVENNDEYEMNFRYEYYKNIAHNIYKYNSDSDDDNIKNITDDQICEDIFNHTFTNNLGLVPFEEKKRIMIPNNKQNYAFNGYYNIKYNISKLYTKEEHIQEPFWGFIKDVINKAFETGIIQDENIKHIYDIFYNKTKTSFFHPLWQNTNDTDYEVFNVKLNVKTRYYVYENIFKPILLKENNDIILNMKITDL